jgi:hypothetical protein
MQRARPTLRALTDDLKLSVPPLDQLLDEIDHPLLRKARVQFGNPSAARERIRAIDDEVVWDSVGVQPSGPTKRFRG